MPQKHTARGAGKGEMVRSELTGGRETGWTGKPHPEQDQIEGRIPRFCDGMSQTRGARRLADASGLVAGPWWQHQG